MLDLNFSNDTENYYCTRFIPPAHLQASSLDPDSRLEYTESIPGDTSSLFELIVKGFLTTTIAVFGIIGNAVNLIILTRPKMASSSMNQLLLGLTVCDTLLVINTIFILGLDAIFEYYEVSAYTNVFIPHALPYMYPIGTTAQTGSIYFTFAVTIERWLAVSYPLRAKSIC